MNKQEESEYTQQEFEVLDRILSAFIHKKERVFIIKEVFKEGYRKRSQELVPQKIKTLINNAYHACRSAQSYGANYHVGRAESILKEALDLCDSFGTNVGGVIK